MIETIQAILSVMTAAITVAIVVIVFWNGMRHR